MSDEARHLILLADRIAGPEEADALRAFVGRLGGRGIVARILCGDWHGGAKGGIRVEDAPRLRSRGPFGVALRGFVPAGGIEGPTLIHALDARLAPAALELAERWRVPYLQGVEEFLPDRSKLRLSRRWCRGLVATSRELADDLTRSFGIPPGLVRYVPRGLAAGGAIPSPRPVGEARVFVVGAAGPLAHGSGFATFLNAARRVLDAGADAEFVLFGQGEDEADLRRRADRLKITDRLTFAGDAAAGLSSWDVLDVYCQPSTVPTVGLGLARAMAQGLPCVAADIEGLRALVAHARNGLRVPPGDTQALARAILDLLDDRPWALGLGREARASVLAEHDFDREAERLAGLYHAVLDEEAHATA